MPHNIVDNSTEFDAAPTNGADVIGPIQAIDSARFTGVSVSVAIEDRTIRTAVLLVIAFWIGLAWFAVMNVRGVTRSTIAGEPFTTAYARRLGRDRLRRSRNGRPASHGPIARSRHAASCGIRDE